MATSSGKLTQNGLFHAAAKGFQNKEHLPERVKVYEKIRNGIWAYNGLFHLIDSWIEQSKGRKVFKLFKPFEAGLFQVDIIIGIQVVYSGNPTTIFQKAF